MKQNILEIVRVRSWLLAMAMISVLSSCLNSNTDPLPSTPTSHVTFYHGSPDTGNLDILLDGTKINSSSFSYGNYSGYASFTSGSNPLRFTNAGSTTALIDVTYNLKESKLYSLFIVNKLASLETLLVTDSAATLTSVGKAGVRLVHLSPDAPAVNIYTTGAEGKLLFGNRAFKTATEFIEVNANAYSFEIKSIDGTTLASVQNLTFSSGRFYTLVVRGLVTPPTGNSNALTLQQLVN